MTLPDCLLSMLNDQTWAARAVCSPIGIIPDEDHITRSDTLDYFEVAQVAELVVDKLDCTYTRGDGARPPIRWRYKVTASLLLVRENRQETWFLGETTFLHY